jgi:DNA-binding beta-propeller fold protein YncE
VGAFPVGRRTLLKAAGGSAAAWLLGACAPPRTSAPPAPAAPAASPTEASASQASPAAAISPSPQPSLAASPAVPERLLGYAFNTGSQDVTVFDPASRQRLETRPLGATVRWLSNEQRFWDGRYIWTFDYPDARVQVIGIDPATVGVARRLPTGGQGPAHSLMLTPDRRTAWVNVAGDDALVAVDLASGQVVAQVKTGKFP